MMKASLLALAAASIGAAVPTSASADTARFSADEAANPQLPEILSLREQAKLRDAWLAERLDSLVPKLMREQGVDLWILIAREYVEDPVVATMLNAESMHARRRTILMFYDLGEGKPIERLTVSRYGLAGLFSAAWKPEEQPDQWQRLSALIAERDPKRIAINTSGEEALADGLTLSQYQGLVDAMPAVYRDRIVPAGPLAIGWLESRVPAEMAVYPDIVRLAHAIIAEGLSNRVITPGKTSAADVVWWYRERIAGLKLDTWFQPSVHIFRAGSAAELMDDEIIQPGDMLWTDFGITYLGLNTDTQHLAYVLKPGETDVPAGLKAGLAAANRVQDALTSSFKTGLTGNDILAAARAKALAEGLEPSIYSHPIGYHGHAAGSAIGFWDNQAATPAGDYPLRAGTAWSIELSATVAVPEWGGQRVQFRTEEDAFFDGATVQYIDGRQKTFHVIASSAN